MTEMFVKILEKEFENDRVVWSISANDILEDVPAGDWINDSEYQFYTFDVEKMNWKFEIPPCGRIFTRIHSNGWTITGNMSNDYYSWVEKFEAIHPTFGKIVGVVDDKIYATSEEGYEDFIKNHPITGMDLDDI